MTLTWKDAVATVLVGAAAVITYASLQHFDWALLGSWRVGSAVLLALGLGTCIASSKGDEPTKNNWTLFASVIGVAALVIALLGIITGSKLAFIALFGAIIGLWALTSLHHLLEKED